MNFIQSPDYTAKIRERNPNIDQDGYEMPFSPSPFGAAALPLSCESIRSPRLTPLQLDYINNGDIVDGILVDEGGASYVPMSSPSATSQSVFNFDKEAVDSMAKRDSEIQSYEGTFNDDEGIREDTYLSMQSTPSSDKSPNLILQNCNTPLRHKAVRTASQIGKHDSGLYSPTANMQSNPQYILMGNCLKTDENNYLTKDEYTAHRDSEHNYINIDDDKLIFKPFQKDYINNSTCSGEYANLLPNGTCRGRTISEASSGLGSISEESPPEYRSQPNSLKSSAMESVIEEPLCV